MSSDRAGWSRLPTMQQTGPRVTHLFVRPAARLPCAARATVEIRPGEGLVGDHAGAGRREVTLLDGDLWQQVCAELGTALSPAARRANVVLTGLALSGTCDRQLRLGAQVVLSIEGETRPCELLDSARPGLDAVLRRAPGSWRGGALARVAQGGHLAVGDAVQWI